MEPRALLPLHYFNQNTSVLNPSASTNNYAAPHSLRILFHGKYCQLLFYIYIHDVLVRIRLHKYIPLCCLSLSTLRVLTLTRHKHIVHASIACSIPLSLSHSKLQPT
jgi:hypothetical protein